MILKKTGKAPKIQIEIQDLQKKVRLIRPAIRKTIQNVLRREGISSAELSIAFVSSQRIRALNIKYLNRPRTTDVLAFRLSHGCKPLFGEVIVSTDAAIQYARRHKVPLKQELMLYVVHGVLHLLGYDDHAPKDIAKMRAKEATYVRA